MSNRRRLLKALLLALRPARWSIFGFRFAPLLLLAAGVWAVIYGGFYHRIPVTETHEEQISIVVPVERPMPPPMPPDAPPGMVPFPPEAFGPPVRFIQAVKITKTTSEEGELTVNRAVTVAGMIRDAEGDIILVRGAAEGPAFCPT
ncbi:MAG: hypothetical protein ABSG53_14895 [Thermoguttaceae bacterium]|jgi:hypothetical protein